MKIREKRDAILKGGSLDSVKNSRFRLDFADFQRVSGSHYGALPDFSVFLLCAKLTMIKGGIDKIVICQDKIIEPLIRTS